MLWNQPDNLGNIDMFELPEDHFNLSQDDALINPVKRKTIRQYNITCNYLKNVPVSSAGSSSV